MTDRTVYNVRTSPPETVILQPYPHYRPRKLEPSEQAAAMEAVKKLTEAELRAIATWSRSPALWPGLVAYHASHGLPE